MGISFVLGAQVRSRVDFVPQQKVLFESSPINIYHLPPIETFWLSPLQLQRQSAELFANPNSIGTIALGAAEGTRTHDGHKTALWHHHIDPGNGALNQGTFSWQLGARTPEEADYRGLLRIQSEAIPAIIQQAQHQQVGLDTETLIQAADLWNQSPPAGAEFIKNLKTCLQQGIASNLDALLCARTQSFYNPDTGELEASGFDGDPTWLEDDQLRRIHAIQQVLEANQERLFAELR
jgi:hypothetical protein